MVHGLREYDPSGAETCDTDCIFTVSLGSYRAFLNPSTLFLSRYEIKKLCKQCYRRVRAVAVFICGERTEKRKVVYENCLKREF